MVGLGGEVMDRRTRGHQRGEHDVAHVVESVAQMIEETLASSQHNRCLGVGVAVPGAVRADDGLVRFAPNLGWVEEPFTELLSARLNRPVSTGNDANLGVLAEHIRGAAVGFSDVAYLSASVGIGGGFLVGGRPLTGASGYAGEVGHMQVDGAGPACRCGAVGCWETKVGENVLLQRAGRLAGGGPEAVAEVIAAARAGEPRAAEAVNDVADWCGVGIRAIVNLFNPQVVVLGGSLAQVWRAAESRVVESVQRNTLLSPRGDAALRSAALGDDSPLIGAAELAFGPVLDHPQTVPQAV
jgi:predicted NBD/HSP70 family sugar kinase